MPGQRQPRREHEAERERDPEQPAPLDEPREVERRRDEREPERHRDEHRAEARPVRERRKVAVEKQPERQLQHVLAAQQEADDPDLQDPNRGDPGDPEEAALGARRQRSAHDQQPEAEPADEEGERDEIEPAHDVLRARRALRTDGGRHRRRGHADAERVDAGDDVAVVRERLPANRVRALREPRHGCDELPRRGDHVRRAGEIGPARRQHLDSLGQRVDRLVELEDDPARRARQLLPERRRLMLQRRMRERRAGQRERDERNTDDERASHRCGAPANCDRWPKIGATSRSQNSSTASSTKNVANPVAATSERGRNASINGKTAQTSAVQPSA